LKFLLKEINAQIPEGLAVHIVMDNYATHKTPKIKAWLARRPHYHVHFTPAYTSWINQIGRWFAELQTRSWLPSHGSATKPSRLYVANFRST
jgi:transposase